MIQKKKTIFSILISTLILLNIFIVFDISNTTQASFVYNGVTYTPTHSAPMTITKEGDSFSSHYAIIEIASSGSGEFGDPYIIEDIILYTADTAQLLFNIHDTDAFVIIKNCIFYGGISAQVRGGNKNINFTSNLFLSNSQGIRLTNTLNNISFSNNIFEMIVSDSFSALQTNQMGLDVLVSNITINNNEFIDYHHIYRSESDHFSSDIKIFNNTSNSQGILIYEGERITINNNEMNSLIHLANTNKITIHDNKNTSFYLNNIENASIFNHNSSISMDNIYTILESENMVIYNSSINSSNIAFSVSDSINISIYENYINSSNSGFIIENSQNISVFNNSILNSLSTSCQFTNIINLEFTNNLVINNSLFAVVVDNSNFTISNNSISNSVLNGLKIDNSHDSLLKNNFINESWMGFNINENNRNITLINNTAKHNIGGGFCINSDNMTLYNNTSNYNYNGFVLNSHNSSYIENEANYNSENGFFTDSFSNFTYIENNTINYNTNLGFHLSLNNSIIENNNALNNNNNIYNTNNTIIRFNEFEDLNFQSIYNASIYNNSFINSFNLNNFEFSSFTNNTLLSLLPHSSFSNIAPFSNFNSNITYNVFKNYNAIYIFDSNTHVNFSRNILINVQEYSFDTSGGTNYFMDNIHSDYLLNGTIDTSYYNERYIKFNIYSNMENTIEIILKNGSIHLYNNDFNLIDGFNEIDIDLREIIDNNGYEEIGFIDLNITIYSDLDEISIETNKKIWYNNTIIYSHSEEINYPLITLNTNKENYLDGEVITLEYEIEDSIINNYQIIVLYNDISYHIDELGLIINNSIDIVSNQDSNTLFITISDNFNRIHTEELSINFIIDEDPIEEEDEDPIEEEDEDKVNIWIYIGAGLLLLIIIIGIWYYKKK